MLLTSFRRVPKGTSGAVSVIGTLSALLGSMMVGGAAFLSSLFGLTPAGGITLGMQFLFITTVGFLGSLVDYFLGVAFQGIYFCPQCEQETERYPRHTCGAMTQRTRGLSWVNNDWVNTACTLSGGLFGVLLGVIF